MLACVTSAWAVIAAPRPLRVFVDSSTWIAQAKIDQFFPEKPALVFQIEDNVKGKPGAKRLPVVFKLDPKAEKENYIPPLLKRLGKDQKALLFVNERGKTAIVFGFMNGSWFHIVGQKSDDKTAWSLISGEPNLRGTFKGTTAELRKLVEDYLAGKATLPEPNEKEMPGFGPELDAKQSASLEHKLGRRGTLFAVIPTLGIGAPLAILAALFPAVFGGVLILFRQWAAFLTVLSVNTTLFLLYLLFGVHLRGSWWGTDAALWFVLTVNVLLGTLWAWRRQVFNLSLGPGALETPRRTETLFLWILAGILGGFSLFLCFVSDRFETSDFLMFVFAAGIVFAAIVNQIRGWFFSQSLNPGRSTEGLILGGVLLAHLIVATTRFGSGRSVEGSVETGDTASGARVAEFVGKRWDFIAPDSGLIASAVLVHQDRLYAAAAHPGFGVGTLYCLDRHSGDKIWEFHDEGGLKQMISSPTLADGRLYLGEGFHDDKNCKLYCLDAQSGKKLWDFPTKGQTESSPAVFAGRVYFGAGNEGFYCVDALTGNEVWRFPGPEYDGRLLRFGAGATVVDNRVYIGTGIDRNRLDTDPGETALFCLDAQTGKQIWKTDTRLPAWGSPVFFKGQIYLGVGNGDVFEDAKHTAPRGAVYCFNADNGEEIWQYPLDNGVIDRVAVDEENVYAGSRNGYIYCLYRDKGRRRWRQNLDSPVVASPVLARWGERTESVFAVSTRGKICCLDPGMGDIQWTYNLTAQTPHLSAAPRLVVNRTSEGTRRQLYFGAGLGDIVGGRPVVFCLEDALKRN
ncbi:MAG: PQQ-binding-like beta-propeller repeat protein [Gemmataceae bacterium]|nr:PQQ-binding-like beta-propeller repeat protein [Gemmataceae bacterium]MCI0740338.1 PQQ-binding-like beta-propeller repeat protein [Gemmataceae bacterium]